MASFAGITFEAEIEQLGGSRDSEISVAHIPGSSINVVDVGGQLPLELPLTLYFTVEADFFTLQGLVSSIGTLVYIDGTFPNTLLKSLGRSRRLPGSGLTFATASFILP